jgi:hypothetical protein
MFLWSSFSWWEFSWGFLNQETKNESLPDSIWDNCLEFVDHLNLYVLSKILDSSALTFCLWQLCVVNYVSWRIFEFWFQHKYDEDLSRCICGSCGFNIFYWDFFFIQRKYALLEFLDLLIKNFIDIYTHSLSTWNLLTAS